MAMRTSGVKLIADTAQYKRDTDGAKKSTEGLKGSIDDVKTASDKAGEALGGLGDELKDGGANARALRQEIESAEKSLSTLAEQFAATDKAAERLDITRSIRKQQGELRQLLKVENMLPPPGESDESGRVFGGRLFAAVGNGMRAAAAGSPGLLWGGAIGAALAPTIGGAIAGGLTAGVGLAGIVAGIKLVAKDPQVAEAGKDIGRRFSEGVALEAEAFKAPVLGALKDIDSFAARSQNSIGAIFRNTAPSVDGLTKSLVGAGDAIMNSLELASSRSAGPLRAVGELVRGVGVEFSTMIDTLSQRSEEGELALGDLQTAITGVVRATTFIVDGAAAFRGWTQDVHEAGGEAVEWIEANSGISKALRGVGIELDITRDGYKAGTHAAQLYRDGVIGAANEANNYSAWLIKARDATGLLRYDMSVSEKPMKAFVGTLTDGERAALGQRNALVALSNQMRSQIDPVFAVINASNTLKTAQDKAAEAVKKHGRNSDEARTATRNLATAAVDMQGKAGALGDTFNGKLSPSMRDTLKAAGLTERQIRDVAKEFKSAKAEGDKYAKNYRASAELTGDEKVGSELWILSQIQQALKKGSSVPSNLVGTLNKTLRGGRMAAGGPVEGYSPTSTADNIPAMLTADEWVIKQGSARKMERTNPGALRHINETGELPQQRKYAAGGPVTWPYPVTAAQTWVPSRQSVIDSVIPSGPGGGATAPFMERLLESRFGVGMISGYRPGSRTLSGNRSYHSMNRAVDFPPLRAMAAFMYNNYKPRLKEAITPYQEYNVHNGSSRRWTGAVWNQHNFAGGNAHNHFAMANGGIISEPVFGVGASGNTYSLGENWRKEAVVPLQGGGMGGPGVVVNLSVALAAGANPREAGRQIAEQLTSYLGGGGTMVVNGRKVLP